MEETSYESVAADYLAVGHRNLGFAYYERPFMVSQLPDLNGRVVLDLGCASGYYSKYCLERGAEVICVDVSRTMVDHTVGLCEGRVHGHVHDIATPFDFLDDSSVDVIICSLVLHYVADWDGPLNEFHRVLKRGGTCIISTHHPIRDYLSFNRKDYFSKRLVENVLPNFGRPVRIKHFVRPLNEYIDPMLRCRLRLVRVAEPLPLPEFAELSRASFDALRKQPLFLFFMLVKE